MPGFALPRRVRFYFRLTVVGCVKAQEGGVGQRGAEGTRGARGRREKPSTLIPESKEFDWNLKFNRFMSHPTSEKQFSSFNVGDAGSSH